MQSDEAQADLTRRWLVRVEHDLLLAEQEVVAREARLRFVERMCRLEGLDLDDPEVMGQAWR